MTSHYFCGLTLSGTRLFLAFDHPRTSVMLKCDHKKNLRETSTFAQETALQGARQADPTELLARWSSQHGMQPMLPNPKCTAAQETTLQTTWASDLAEPVVVWVSH
jgi:hypothetical protein